mmetsp:Transcript_14341/g.54043  ORF Transcript_14341/g.54043 Transcript_14341/m.54043 type:complete len:322 (+) Transcript_14341:1604-2569(+)
MRRREEAVHVIEGRVLDLEAAAGGPILRAAAHDRLHEVVRARLDVEDEVQGRSADGQSEDPSDRRDKAPFDHDRREKRGRLQQAHTREDHLQDADGHDPSESDLLEAVERKQRFDVHERVEREDGEHRADVVPDSTPVERQQAQEVEAMGHPVQVARQGLLGVSLRQLGFELVRLAEADVAALADNVVLLELDLPSARHGIVPREDVFRQVDALGGLGDAAPGHHVNLVEEIWVAVVQTHAQRPIEDSLTQRHESGLLHRHVARQSGYTPREDVLAEAEDGQVLVRGGARDELVVLLELLQQVPNLEPLLEVPVLVHVDRL